MEQAGGEAFPKQASDFPDGWRGGLGRDGGHPCSPPLPCWAPWHPWAGLAAARRDVRCWWQSFGLEKFGSLFTRASLGELHPRVVLRNGDCCPPLLLKLLQWLITSAA